MNKISILFGVIMTIYTININAQEKKVDFGFKGGLNYSTLTGDFNGDFKRKIGFNFGSFLNLNLSEKFNLKPELLFSKQGAEYIRNIENIDGGFDPTINSTDYIVDIDEYLILLPLMIDYYLSDDFNIEFGPQFAYVVSKDISDNNEDLTFFKRDDFDKFEIGLNLGIGYNFAENYRIGVRYNYGITERDNFNSSVLQLGLNFKI